MQDLRPPVFERKFLVDKVLQLRVLLHTVYVLLTTASFTFILIKIASGDTAFGLGGTAAAILAIFFMIGAALLSAALLSHSIAGPIYHLHSNMKNILSGDHPQMLRLRKSDHFQDVAITYNKLINKLLPSPEPQLGNIDLAKPWSDQDPES